MGSGGPCLARTGMLLLLRGSIGLAEADGARAGPGGRSLPQRGAAPQAAGTARDSPGQPRVCQVLRINTDGSKGYTRYPLPPARPAAAYPDPLPGATLIRRGLRGLLRGLICQQPLRGSVVARAACAALGKPSGTTARPRWRRRCFANHTGLAAIVKCAAPPRHLTDIRLNLRESGHGTVRSPR